MFFFISFYSFSTTTGQKEVSLNYLKSNLEFLADDLLEGREATTRGEKLASLFIAKELQKYGIKPFGDNGTYFQNFDMQVKGLKDGSTIKLNDENGKPQLEFGKHFIISKRGVPSVEFANIEANIVFAGYGAIAEDISYNDYKNIDANGKYVLIYDDLPTDEESPFDPVTHRRLGYWSTKRTIAQEQGAIGVFIIASQATESNWDYYIDWALSPTFGLPKEPAENKTPPKLIPSIGINKTGLQTLMANEEVEYSELIEAYGNSILPTSFELKKKVSVAFELYSDTRPARNVVGILEGSDDKLKSEYVSIGAHYDHEGKRGDKIWNGADDNGSGTVAILELARKLSLDNNNNRSILFLFHTAEEKGLIGAKYYTNNIDYIDDIVVNINIDMVGRGSTDSIHCIGSDKLSTDLYNIVEEANNDNDYFTLDYRFNAPDDPNRFYWRSDHVHFANKNIPIVFFYDYMKVDYHKPTDTVDKINFEKIYKITELVKDISLEISNRDERLKVDKVALSN